MITWSGQKMTANEWAKNAVYCYGEKARHAERFDIEFDDMTPRERGEVKKRIVQHLDRVAKFLGVD